NGGIPTVLAGPGSSSVASSINNLGQVAGGVNLAGPDQPNANQATVWTGGVPTLLAGPPGSRVGSAASKINDHGQVAGFSTPGGSGPVTTVPTVWNGTTPTVLPSGGSGAAIGINNLGQVVGYSSISGAVHATMWNGISVTDLGAVAAHSIND